MQVVFIPSHDICVIVIYCPAVGWLCTLLCSDWQMIMLLFAVVVF